MWRDRYHRACGKSAQYDHPCFTLSLQERRQLLVSTKNANNIENQYHTYAIEWLQEEEYGRDVIRFLYDGQVQAVQSETLENMDNEYFWPFNKPNFILLNMAIGGSMGGQVNDQIFSQPIQMKVDWVRVYQRKEIE